MFAYRPGARVISALIQLFQTPPPNGGLVSNFPALARRCEELQAGIINQPSYSADAPQERDVDLRLANHRAQRALDRLSQKHQSILLTAYNVVATNERVEKALTPILAPLAEFSRFAPVERYLDEPAVMTGIQMELDQLWRDAHAAFEQEYTR